MDSFGPTARPEPPPRPGRPEQPPWSWPDDVSPVSLPFAVFLVRTPWLVVFADRLRVFPTGFEFALHVRREVRPADIARGDACDWQPPFAQEHDSEEQLRFGVIFPDGRRARAQQGWSVEWRTPEGPRPPVVSPLDGGGSWDRWDQGFWVWGLPEDGPVTLFWSWLDEGLPEARVELDGDALRAAAAEAVVFWPEPEGE